MLDIVEASAAALKSASAQLYVLDEGFGICVELYEGKLPGTEVKCVCDGLNAFVECGLWLV